MIMFSRFYLLLCLSLTPAAAQSLSGGAIVGVVKDASGATLPEAKVSLINYLNGYEASAVTAADGTYRLPNLPYNTYHLEIRRTGFQTLSRDIDVRTPVPQKLDFQLAPASESSTLDVHAFGDEVLENVPYAHTDVDTSQLRTLPLHAPGSRLSDAIMFAAPGVVADSDGFFHPLGDHAQVGFNIDGQPITDQQSKRFSTQMPVNAIQSMELITGAPNAEYGDKTSLVVNTVTRSGLGLDRFSGQSWLQYGSFGTATTENSFAAGQKHWGNFLVANAETSGRFLDTPEFRPYHAKGNGQTIFNRFDLQPDSRNSFHLNLLGARNWFQIPNTLDVPGADQRQLTQTINVAPSYQRVLSPKTLLSANFFYRRDTVDFFPSRDRQADLPVSVAQSRSLANTGFRTDVAHVQGRWNFKSGIQFSHTKLREQFDLLVTDSDEIPDINRFRFNESGRVRQFAWYAQNSLTLGNLILNTGVRIDRYDGLVQKTAAQPRGGLSYRVRKTGTILRASYSRTLETPYNENLLLASASGATGAQAAALFGVGGEPLQTGGRNQYNLGFQQAIGRLLVIEADYFWKFTRNAYDFGVLYNTPIAFPISWPRSKLDGVSVRVATRTWKGLQAFSTIGSTRARFFPAEDPVFRIDHDQQLQQNFNLRYQYKQGPWMNFTWRYDDGLVTTGVPSCEDALSLTPNQQAAIGFFGNASRCGSALIRIPQPGTENDDHNPARMRGRNLFHLSVGHDNLLRGDRYKVSLRLSAVNLTNKVALYNFLSTFGGTHFVTPRAFSAAVGFTF
jgi:hypothetical protein